MISAGISPTMLQTITPTEANNLHKIKNGEMPSEADFAQAQKEAMAQGIGAVSVVAAALLAPVLAKMSLAGIAELVSSRVAMSVTPGMVKSALLKLSSNPSIIITLTAIVEFIAGCADDRSENLVTGTTVADGDVEDVEVEGETTDDDDFEGIPDGAVDETEDEAHEVDPNLADCKMELQKTISTNENGLFVQNGSIWSHGKNDNDKPAVFISESKNAFEIEPLGSDSSPEIVSLNPIDSDVFVGTHEGYRLVTIQDGEIIKTPDSLGSGSVSSVWGNREHELVMSDFTDAIQISSKLFTVGKCEDCGVDKTHALVCDLTGPETERSFAEREESMSKMTNVNKDVAVLLERNAVLFINTNCDVIGESVSIKDEEGAVVRVLDKIETLNDENVVVSSKDEMFIVNKTNGIEEDSIDLKESILDFAISSGTIYAITVTDKDTDKDTDSKSILKIDSSRDQFKYSIDETLGNNLKIDVVGNEIFIMSASQTFVYKLECDF